MYLCFYKVLGTRISLKNFEVHRSYIFNNFNPLSMLTSHMCAVSICYEMYFSYFCESILFEKSL